MKLKGLSMRWIIIIALLTAFLSGCALREADVDKIRLGMTRGQVKLILGKANVAKDDVLIYNNIGELDYVHIEFKGGTGESSDCVTNFVRFGRDPQMRGGPR